MIADALDPRVVIDRLIVALALDEVGRQGAHPGAEAAVGLLERDYVGVELVQHRERALRASAAIGADRLAHIVTGDEDGARLNLHLIVMLNLFQHPVPSLAAG